MPDKCGVPLAAGNKLSLGEMDRIGGLCKGQLENGYCRDHPGQGPGSLGKQHLRLGSSALASMGCRLVT